MSDKTMLRLERGGYPNGSQFVRVFTNRECVGVYDIVDGGFLPIGCRKPSTDERDAQIRVIQRYVTRHIGLAADAAKLYEEV